MGSNGCLLCANQGFAWGLVACARQRPGSTMKTACGFLRLLVHVPTQDCWGHKLPSPGVRLLRGLCPVFAHLNCGEYVQHVKIFSFSHSFLDKTKIILDYLTVPYFMEWFIDNCPLSINRHQRDQNCAVVSGAQHHIHYEVESMFIKLCWPLIAALMVV
jgi:hypothetical protein